MAGDDDDPRAPSLGGVANMLQLGAPGQAVQDFRPLDRIRVPLPAAMILVFNTMRLPLPPSRRAPIIAVLSLVSWCCSPVAACARARLQPGPVGLGSAGLDGYAELDDAQSLASAPASTTGSPGIAAPSCPTTPTCWPGPRPRAPRHRGADVRLGPRPPRPLRHRARAGRAVTAEVAPTLACSRWPASRSSGVGERRLPRRLPAPRPSEAGRGCDPARDRGAPRTSTAGSTRPSAPSSPARSPNRPGTATSPMPSGCAGSRTCWRSRAGWPRAGPPRPRRRPRSEPDEAPAALAARTYRRYQARLVDYNCRYAASLHNLTTAEQRKKKAVKKLKGWEDELRALAGDGAS